MSEALKRAREEAFVNRERAAGFLAETKACVAEGYSDEDEVAFAAEELEVSQAALDAIDAAIAAEKSTKDRVQVSIDLGGDVPATFDVTTAAAKGLTETRSRNPIRIPIVVDTSGLEEALATGGYTTGKAALGIVGERVGETEISRETAERFRLKTAELFGKIVASGGQSGGAIQLGDKVEHFWTGRDGTVHRKLVEVVEIWENAGDELLGKLTERELEKIPAGERTVYWVRSRNREENAVSIDNLRRL